MNPEGIVDFIDREFIAAATIFPNLHLFMKVSYSFHQKLWIAVKNFGFS